MKKIISLLLTICILVTGNNIDGGVISHQKQDDLYIEYGIKFPSVIKITTDRSYCSGVIIDAEWVITTKHSVQYKDNIRVIYKDKEFIPEKIIYNKSLDVALIKVKLPKLDHNEIAEIIPINDVLHSMCQIVGYGKTGNGNTGATVYDMKKRAGNNIVVSENDTFITFNFNKDTPVDLPILIAHGDSGGGVFLDNKLIAINAFVTAKDGDQIADSTYGDVSGHIKISKIHGWIRSILD